VDGCAGGWVAVTLGPVGSSAAPDAPDAPTPSASRTRGTVPGPRPWITAMTVSVTVAATLDELALAGVTGIDMPLGLLATGWRDADALARRALGRRGVTVFAIPPRPVWDYGNYADANRVCKRLTGKGMSIQAWGLRRKIAEADAFRRAATATDGVRLYEVHPELSFAAMAGASVPDSKHTLVGLAIRRELLAKEGIILPPKVAGAAEDDLLDAAAVAWSARRIAAGEAMVLTTPTQRADDGTEITIRY
jgi:predicted RNase H-like nuclease